MAEYFKLYRVTFRTNYPGKVVAMMELWALSEYDVLIAFQSLHPAKFSSKTVHKDDKDIRWWMPVSDRYEDRTENISNEIICIEEIRQLETA